MNLYRIENMIGIDWVHSQYVPIKLVVDPLALENRKVNGDHEPICRTNNHTGPYVFCFSLMAINWEKLTFMT